MQETLLALGINAHNLIAGFCGGVVFAFVLRQGNPLAIVSSALVGAFTSNYLGGAAGEIIGRLVGGTPPGPGPASFVTGLSSTIICQAIVEAAKRWRPGAAAAPAQQQQPPPQEQGSHVGDQ